MNELKKNFFELGVAYGQFSAKPVPENYEILHKAALSLELQFPNYDDLKDLLWWDFVPPTKWFKGSSSQSFKNCYEIGILAYLRFLLALPPSPNIRTVQISEAEQKLKDLFEKENITLEVLDDYLAGLKVDDPNVSLRKFVDSLSKFLPDDGHSIFDNLSPTPSVFDDEVSEMLQLTVDEAYVCYKHECYLATIALCGKIIETLLANAFQALMEKPPSEKMSFGDIRAALRGMGTPLDDSVDELLDLIYTHRSVVIHRGNLRKISFPTEGQAKHVAGLTQEVINIIYAYFSDRGATSGAGPNGA